MPVHSEQSLPLWFGANFWTMGDKRSGDKSSRRAAAASQSRREHWKDQPDEHDFPAALDYLTLVMDTSAAEQLVAELRDSPVVRRKAKDLLRASDLPLQNAAVPTA